MSGNQEEKDDLPEDAEEQEEVDPRPIRYERFVGTGEETIFHPGPGELKPQTEGDTK